MDPILLAQSAEGVSGGVIGRFLNPEMFVLLIPVIAIIGGLGYAMISTLAIQWRKAKKTEFELSLKAQMIEQGKSVEEIERVLNAGRSPDRT